MQDRISQVEEASCTARPDHTFRVTGPVALKGNYHLIHSGYLDREIHRILGQDCRSLRLCGS
jgi:hypothetical protein